MGITTTIKVLKQSSHWNFITILMMVKAAQKKYKPYLALRKLLVWSKFLVFLKKRFHNGIPSKAILAISSIQNKRFIFLFYYLVFVIQTCRLCRVHSKYLPWKGGKIGLKKRKSWLGERIRWKFNLAREKRLWEIIGGWDKSGFVLLFAKIKW